MLYLDSIIIKRDKTSIFLNSPAKINLYLRVLDKRPDGYHNLENVMQTINFCDEIEIRLMPASKNAEILLECNDAQTPRGDENIVVRAAKKFLNAAGIKNDIRIRLTKKIPMGAGLGGGSSNAGTTLLGLNSLTGNPLTMSKMIEMAIGLGSDVPFFLFGGLSLCSGKGEIINPMEQLPEFWIVLVNPGIPISTKQIYELYEKNRLTRHDKSVNLLNCGSLKRVSYLISIMRNDLEEAAIAQYPKLGDIIKSLEKAGCLKAMVTGSGSTVFGICMDRETAERVRTNLRSPEGEGFLIVAASNRL